VKEGLLDKVNFEQKLEDGEEMNHANIWKVGFSKEEQVHNL